MNQIFSKASIAVLVTVGSMASANAGGVRHHCPPTVIHSAPVRQAPRVIYKTVQPTPSYDVRRPEVVSGTRLTVFANFLQQEEGFVYFDVSGTTSSCKVVDWCPNSVTFDLPALGLSGRQDAKIRVVLPNGRVAKSISVILVPQPAILVHQETIPQPMPPTASNDGRGVYAGSASTTQSDSFVK